MGSHIIDGEFQSDKYPTCPRGKVPLSVTDQTAQDLLWQYAQRRRAVDADFAADLETCLRVAGYTPLVPYNPTEAQELRSRLRSVSAERDSLDYLLKSNAEVYEATKRDHATGRELLKRMTADRDAAQRRIAELTADLGLADRTGMVLHTDIKERDQRIRTLTMERDSLISQLDHMCKVSLDSSQAAHDAETERDRLRAEVARLRGLMKRIDEGERRVLADNDEVTAERDSLRVEVERKDADIGNYRAVNDSLRQQLEAARVKSERERGAYRAMVCDLLAGVLKRADRSVAAAAAYEAQRAAEPDIRDEDDDTSGFVPWPAGQPPRYNGSGEPCDMWIGPCCCGATHSASERVRRKYKP
jgi:chromosome segregation ATPase